jgi:2-polyprenyl-6-methoxyphenol hydroxylase-like FAD-dependent oxidoreductase
VVDLGTAVSVVLDEGFRKTVEPFSAVIGADGIDSMIRHAIGIPFDGFEYENYWGVAEYEIANWPYDVESLSIFLNQRGEFGMAAGVGPDRYRFVANTPKPRFQVPGNYNVLRTLSEASFSIRVGQANRYQAHNRVFLAGAAAHVHAPIGGRGMNLGIEDATVLAQLFEEDRLERYTAMRRPIATAAIRRSERLMRIAGETNRTEIALRNTFLPIVLKLPAMQRRFMARIAGLR